MRPDDALVARLRAAGIPAEDASSEARRLLCHALNVTRERLFLRTEPLTDDEAAALEPLIARRAAREPLAYILGERGFYGRTFTVTPAVLIPRPETELLVEVTAAALESVVTPRIADIGTGSGCIAIALAASMPQAMVYATDLSDDALAVAAANAVRNGVDPIFLQGDLCAPLPDGLRFEAIVSNPPYIAPSERIDLAPEVRDWEPASALFDPAGDGLGFYRRLAADATPRLAPGGLLAVEVGMGQAPAVEGLWRDAGLVDVRTHDDLAGIGRVVVGKALWEPPTP